VIGNFLVMVKSGAYLERFEGSKTICVKIPSLAEHFSYEVADKIAYSLRSRGFEGTLVCASNGLPATPQLILDAATPSDEFTVVFNKAYYSAGRDKNGSPLGSRDRKEAKAMSRAAAEEICQRLIKDALQRFESC
jgi:hypothetical protein